MNDQAAKPQVLLKIKDLADRLGCSRQTIHNMLRQERCPIPPIIGTKPPKWRAADVDAFLRAQTPEVSGGE